MKRMKKLFAILMTMAMVMGLGITGFAATGTKPTATDAENVSGKIIGVEDKATITAYQIIDAVYNANGFVGYKWVAGDKAGQTVQFTEDDKGTDVVVGLTDDYITSIASDVDGLTYKNPRTEELEVGTWMLLVTGSDLNKVYNPMIISVYYSEDGSNNDMITGNVNANDSWSLATSGAYAKSSEVDITKTVNDLDNKGETDKAAVGEIVTFTITGTIPSYSADSTALYKITDKITNGLEYVLPQDSATIAPTVKINNTEVSDENYTVVMKGNNSFEITFDAEYIKGLAAVANNRNLEIVYQAKVTEAAITNAAKNDVTVDYDQGSDEDTEYVYTVSFDGVAKKVDENGDALANAEFTLYGTWTDSNSDDKKTADELSDMVGTPVFSSVNGNIVFKGLDADKTYYLTETKAPDNYTINSAVYTITFGDCHEGADGSLTYAVYVDGDKVATVTTYGQSATPVGDQFTITNTKLSSLPSTGGMGTTIFTIAGCVIMISAAGLFFASRRKAN